MKTFCPRGGYTFFIFFLLTITNHTLAQTEKEYTDLLISITTADDKPARAARLAAVTEKVYQPSNMSYFNGFYQAALHTWQTDPRRAITYIDKAINAYLGYPEGYTLMDANNLVEACKVLCGAYNSVGLTSSGIQRLEAMKSPILSASKLAKCSYYNLLGDQYLLLSRHEKAKEAFDAESLLLSDGEPMVVTQKSDPKWKREMNARMEPLYQDMAKFYYNYSMSKFHFGQQRYEAAIPFMKNYMALNDKFNQKISEDTRISRFARMLVPDSIKVMDDENQKYQKIRQHIGGDKLDFIVALCKTGRANEALPLINTLHEKAYYHHLQNEPELSETAYQEIYKAIEDFRKWRYYRWAATTWRNQIDPTYLQLQAFKKNFTYAYPKFREQLASRDKSLRDDFAFFSENEKKEYFKDYANRLSQYYSLLLSMAEEDRSKYSDILNKSLQTKGLIMEATKEQEKRFEQVTDEEVRQDLGRILQYREKLLAFSQVSATNAEPLMEDSVLHYTLMVNNLQKKVNEKIGVPQTLLKSITWKDLQLRLKPDEAYVEVIKIQRDNFHFDKTLTQYWAFVIKPAGEPVSILLGKGDEFEKSLAAYQNAIRFQLEDDKSYGLYWQRLAEVLAGHTKVYFSGDGIYHLINPLVLKNPASGKYLVDEIQLVRVSAGRDLLEKNVSAKLTPDAVLVGNPDFTMSRKTGALKVPVRTVTASMVAETRGGFGVLPGTEKEVQAIATYARAKSENVVMLTGTDATESNVKKISNPGVLHFATHGIFDNYSNTDSYLRSKLILAGAGDPEPFTLNDHARYDDGYLTAFEVTQLNLSDTRLVVLSACETGLGEVQSGEGVWGLQRAFQVAGARNILGSLWKISDEATAVFMDVFYKSYYNGATIRTAYIDAMKTTRSKYPHPYFWGAFVLMGRE